MEQLPLLGFMMNSVHGAKASSEERIIARLSKRLSDVAVKKYTSAGVELYVVESAELPTCVLFLGSNDLVDWARNFNFCMAEFEQWKGKVHKGFGMAYRKVVKPLLNQIEADYELSAGTCYLGHSQGAAFATFAALDKEEEKQPCTIVTFGAPCIGNEEFANDVDERIENNIRVQNYYDVVSWVNRFIPGQGARHAGETYYFEGDLDLFKYEKGAEPQFNVHEFVGSLFRADEGNLLIAHSPAIYEQVLQNHG